MVLALALVLAMLGLVVAWQVRRKTRRRRLFQDAARAAHTPSESAQLLLDDAQAALSRGDAVTALRMIDDACLLAGEDPMVMRRAEVLRSRVA
jgi:hypothetical protein